MRTRLLILLLGMTVALVSACGGAPRKRPALQPGLTPPQEYRAEAYGKNNPGSLFAASEEDTLFADSRARRVGDIVVVKLVENTKAQNKAETNSNKDSNNNYKVSHFFGASKVGFLPLVGMGPLTALGKLGPQATVATPNNNNPFFETNSDSSLSATGKTKRENYVTTSMAARIIRVMPGGILQIEGMREIRVNEETEYMVVKGLIRAKDVDADNTIYSTQIADASIEYYGKGVLADKQKQGWFTRLMDNLWPF